MTSGVAKTFTRYEKVVHALAPAGVPVHGPYVSLIGQTGRGISTVLHMGPRGSVSSKVVRVANPKDEMWMAREGWSHKGQPRPTGSGWLGVGIFTRRAST